MQKKPATDIERYLDLDNSSTATKDATFAYYNSGILRLYLSNGELTTSEYLEKLLSNLTGIPFIQFKEQCLIFPLLESLLKDATWKYPGAPILHENINGSYNSYELYSVLIAIKEAYKNRNLLAINNIEEKLKQGSCSPLELVSLIKSNWDILYTNCHAYNVLRICVCESENHNLTPSDKEKIFIYTKKINELHKHLYLSK